MFSTSLFDYELPEELIAQVPTARRDESRMLALNTRTGVCTVQNFTDIIDYLSPGDAMIFNDTRVLRCRMYGQKDNCEAGAKFEIMLISPADTAHRSFHALLKPGKRAKPGTIIYLLDRSGQLNSAGDHIVVNRRDGDGFIVDFPGADADELQQKYGHMPLPPYIKRPDDVADEERYQTIFAEKSGAVAAPTAGLHFSPEIMEALAAKKVNTASVTLHVGIGTFRPVTVENPAEHKMHSENFVLSPETAELVNATRQSGKKVLAVGTTSVRVLESCAAPVPEQGIYPVMPQMGSTDIFLYPPREIKTVDMLLTNFHLPKSTLLMLVSCFADREKILAAYEVAKREKMRFFSYGDCMLLY